MLTPFKEILKDAELHRYAVGAFNCLSVENVKGAILTAEELRSPVILQLAEVQFPEAPIELMAPLFLQAARRASVPVAVHLDHGQSLETCVKAIRLGFNSVMFDGAALPYETNVSITKEVTRIAKAAEVDVEAELGKVGISGMDTADVFTDVEQSKDYLKQTGVDALAIAIGNLHGHYVATPHLNIQRLKELHEANRIPLVLHGGSGTSVEDFKSCIHNGICKINVATAIQMGITAKILEYLKTASSPNYIAMKGVMIEASKAVIEDHMRLFESNGHA